VLKKAEKYQKLLEKGVVSSRADLGRREEVSKARITQILYLTKLHPKIEEYLTSLTDESLIRHFGEEKVRQIARTEREGQPKEFEKLKKHAKKMSTNIFK
jgi:hypothetical protein